MGLRFRLTGGEFCAVSQFPVVRCSLTWNRVAQIFAPANCCSFAEISPKIKIELQPALGENRMSQIIGADKKSIPDRG